MKEVVVVANLHGNSNTAPKHVVPWLRGLGFAVALISEMGRLDHELKSAGEVYASKDDNPRDVAVVVAHRLQTRAAKFINAVYEKLTRFVRRPGSNKPRLWRDRWVVRVRIWGRVYYAVHANALVANKDGEWLRNEGAKVWREALTELAVMVRADAKKGLRIRLGGDLNMFMGEPLSEFFDMLNLDWFSDDRVMYIAWDRKTTRAVRKTELPVAPGSDAHGVLLVELERKKR